jgi:hypothetical protein
VEKKRKPKKPKDMIISEIVDTEEQRSGARKRIVILDAFPDLPEFNLTILKKRSEKQQ